MLLLWVCVCLCVCARVCLCVSVSEFQKKIYLKCVMQMAGVTMSESCQI
jgi:hypothetical protein